MVLLCCGLIVSIHNVDLYKALEKAATNFHSQAAVLIQCILCYKCKETKRRT